MNRRGFALMMVVAVLGVLAVLATASATMAQMERRASRQRLVATRALLLARSGAEDALARIAGEQNPDAGVSRYQGEDWDADGTLSSREARSEAYRVTGAGTRPDTEACPVRHALRPSFWVSRAGAPDLEGVDGRDRGYSGRLARAGDPGGHYVLKVSPQAGIHINGGDPTVRVDTYVYDYNLVLRSMLAYLAMALDQEDGNPPATSPVRMIDGHNLINRRPLTPRGWESWEQVRDIALGGSQVKLDILRPYLTLDAWTDKRVIASSPPTLPLVGLKSWADLKISRTRPTPDFERINGKVVGRAPVNLAWARTRRPALFALLGGLRGYYLDELNARNEASGDWIGALRNVSFSTSDHTQILTYLMTSTSELATWEQWNAFCESIPGSLLEGTTDVEQAKRDALKANFNPNSDLNKFNPNRSRWKSVDKMDRGPAEYATEFSLEPLHGHEITSLGRVLDPSGRLLATQTCSLIVSGPSAIRLSTQREFVCQDLGSLDVAGDEVGVRAPRSFLSTSSGSSPTWGAKVRAPGGPRAGLGLQVYPEPWTVPGVGAPLSMTPADYDGSLQLATVETAPEDAYGVPVASPDMKLLACFDDSLDLENPGTDVWGPNLPDLMQVATTELGLSLLDPAKPNTLYPDGVYSEKDRTPSYHDAGNAHGTHGLMSFWVKPNYDAEKSIPSAPSPFGRGRRWVSWTNRAPGEPGSSSPDQFFLLGESDWGPPRTLWMFEHGHSPSDLAHEHFFKASQATVAHRWRLVTICWDFEALEPHAPAPSVGELIVNDGADPVDIAGVDTYNLVGHANDPLGAADITAPDIAGPHRIWLGPASYREWGVVNDMGSGADATLDEFALYDLGVLGSNDAVVTKTFAQARYREGRYYKGARYQAFDGYLGPAVNEAASYLSPPLRLPAGALLRHVSWTWTRPAECPGDYAAVELVKEDLAARSYLWDPVSSSSRAASPDRQRWDIGRRLDEGFRARVLFLRKPGPSTDAYGTLDPDVPLLDSPVFDDLTVVYTPAGGPGISSWRRSE